MPSLKDLRTRMLAGVTDSDLDAALRTMSILEAALESAAAQDS